MLGARTAPEANETGEGFSEEALAGREVGLVEGEVVAADDGGDDEVEFHFRDVAADAGAGPGAEWDERLFLGLREPGWGEPALGAEQVGVAAPDGGGMVHGVGGDGEGGVGREVVA